jgi:hypothetical protein
MFRKRIVPKGNDKVTFDYFDTHIGVTNSVVNELYDRVKKLEQSVTYCDNCGDPILLYEKWEYVGKNRVSHSSHLKH